MLQPFRAALLAAAVSCSAVTSAGAADDAAAPRGPGATAVFFCDFRTYPPAGNVETSYEACDFSINYDDHVHLRLTRPRASRLSLGLSLPAVPAGALLEVDSLASAGADGKGVAPISILVNGKAVVENWNVGKTGFSTTRWPVGDKLRSGRNTIELRAGELRTACWIRRVEILARFDRAVSVSLGVPRVEHPLFWEGRFNQCSYNALATVLDHFYGVEPWTNDRASFQKRTFVAALEKFHLGGYFGWAPWTSYMVQAGTIVWNGRKVDDLEAERFALRTKKTPELQGRVMVVHYGKGEKKRLEKELLARLKKGPVIIWTPYAAALDRGRNAWRHVRQVGAGTDAVRFHPSMTHSVVLNLEGDRIVVYDNSWPNGVWTVEAGTIVATTSTMAGSVRLKRQGGKTLLGNGFRGVKDDAYNVVFWKKGAKR